MLQTMTELEQYIKSYFEIISPDELNKVSSLFKLITLKKGEYFLKEGKICNKFCFIKAGHLRVYEIFEDREITQWIATKGHLGTDFSSFFFKQTSRWNIQALESTELFVITKDDYDKIDNAIPQWHELERTFLIKCFTIMESRIFDLLSMTAEK